MHEPNLPDLTEVLAEVNRLRAERGMALLDALPPGSQNSPARCPVANALTQDRRQAYVVPSRYERRAYFFFAGERGEHHLPPLLNYFAHAFDRGAYPDLVA